MISFAHARAACYTIVGLGLFHGLALVLGVYDDGARFLSTLTGGKTLLRSNKGFPWHYRSAASSPDAIEPRAFEMWSGDLPCDKPQPAWSRAPADTGFLFVKLPKTGSTAAASVNLRLARNVAKTRDDDDDDVDICRSRSNNVDASGAYADRIREQSFLWTVIRDPSDRAVAEFFDFAVSRGRKVAPTLENFVQYTRGKRKGKDYYLRTLALTSYNDENVDPLELASEIMTEYNFVGVAERLHESFVALSMLLGLQLTDVLYVTDTDENSAGYDPQCNKIAPTNVTAGMSKYLASEEWLELTKWDRALHRAANHSLDLTIESLGRHDFEQNLAIYNAAQQQSQDKCRRKTTFPCSGKGKRNAVTDCLFLDSGCGLDCLDGIVVAEV